MIDDPQDDTVGFGRPPKSGRFKPGKSGNPLGKRSKTRRRHSDDSRFSVLEDVMEELSQTLVVRENGREKKISKQRAFVIALINSAIKGDVRAINAVVTLAKNFGAATADEPAAAVEDEGDLDDLNILEAFVSRERARRDRQQAAGDSAEERPSPTSTPTDDSTVPDREEQ
jgi:hypothetical protein